MWSKSTDSRTRLSDSFNNLDSFSKHNFETLGKSHILSASRSLSEKWEWSKWANTCKALGTVSGQSKLFSRRNRCGLMFQLSTIIWHILNKHKPSGLKVHSSAGRMGDSAGLGQAHSGVSGWLIGHLWIDFVALGHICSHLGSWLAIGRSRMASLSAPCGQ